MRTEALTKGERTRQQIVAAAAPIFNQKGYEGSTLSDLMSATGLKKGGIYRHFSSKEELAVEAFNYTWHAARDIRFVGLDGLTGVAWLKGFIGNFVENRNPVAGGCPILNTAVDTDDGNPTLRARAARALKAWRARLESKLRDAAERGELQPGVDPKAVATLIVATLEGALMMSRLEKSYDSLRRVQQHLNQYLDTQVGDTNPAIAGVSASVTA